LLKVEEGRMVSVGEIGEFGLIERIRARRPIQDEDLVVGIGDDCAVVRRGPVLEVLTTDCLVEGTHYRDGWLSMKDIGWKVLAVNVSDVAAIGGIPRHALVTLFLPGDFEVKQVDDIYEGMEECGDIMGVSIVGGDIVRTVGPFAVSVALSGVCERDQLVLRSGAREDDLVVVTGALGEASVGMRMMHEGSAGGRSGDPECIRRFQRPMPRLNEARTIVQTLLPSSMIDISDGLLSDLWHIMDASGVGAVLEADRIPVGQCVLDYFQGDREEALSQAMGGGEDYELLFTVNSRHEELLAEVSRGLGVGLTPIGRITAKGTGVKLAKAGGERELGRTGFDHFGPAAK
jgi:thiamine-monophosphate kinase